MCVQTLLSPLVRGYFEGLYLFISPSVQYMLSGFRIDGTHLNLLCICSPVRITELGIVPSGCHWSSENPCVSLNPNGTFMALRHIGASVDVSAPLPRAERGKRTRDRMMSSPSLQDLSCVFFMVLWSNILCLVEES